MAINLLNGREADRPLVVVLRPGLISFGVRVEDGEHPSGSIWVIAVRVGDLTSAPVVVLNSAPETESCVFHRERGFSRESLKGFGDAIQHARPNLRRFLTPWRHLRFVVKSL